MQDHLPSDILVQAEAAYKRVLTDPAGSSSLTQGLVRDARRSGDVEALVVALRAHAWAERSKLCLRPAKRLLDEAAELAREHRLRTRYGEVLVTRAAVHSELGRIDAAQADLAQAQRLVPAGRRAELVLQQAAVLYNLGRFTESRRLLQTVVEDPRTPVEVRAKVANNLAYLEAQRGRYDEAARYAEQAMSDAADLGQALVAYFAQTRAWVTMQQGRLAESLRQFQRAGELYEAAGLPLGEHYLEYADALVQLRLLPEALDAVAAAADQFTKHHALLMAADADLQAARLTLLAGDAKLARTRAVRAAARFRRQARTASVARAAVVAHQAQWRMRELTAAQLRSLQGCAVTLEQLGVLSDAVDAYLTGGRVAAAKGRVDCARLALGAASRLSRKAPFLVRLNGYVAAALAARVSDDSSGVVRAARAGLDDLDQHRAALPSMELRALASGHGAELGALGLSALLPTGSGTRVFDWMERTRAAALVTVDVPFSDDVESELDNLRSLHAELAEHRRQAGREPVELLHRIADAETRVRRATWSASAESVAAAETCVRHATWRADTSHDDGHTTVTAGELRSLLDGGVLVEYGLLDGRVVAAVVEARRVRLVELGALTEVAHDTDALLFALRRLARPATRASTAAAGLSARTALTRLHDQLVRPLAIPPDVPLVVVPVGDLQRVPWAPLHEAPTTVAPSASYWARTRRRRAADSDAVTLVAGPDLPGAVDEVDVLRKVYPRAKVLVPPHSTAGAVTDSLLDVALAHLACHGRVRADNPTFSSLLLSDGPLTVHELGIRGVAPHRIVLAACDSGVQVTYPGDEALGFVSALFARGTAGLVASTVLVPDVDAVPLMRSLHEHIARGAPLAAALHAARGELDLDEPGQYVNSCAFNAYGAA